VYLLLSEFYKRKNVIKREFVGTSSEEARDHPS